MIPKNEIKEEKKIPKVKNEINANKIETKEKKINFDEKGNPLVDKIIDQDEFILKDERVIKLMKEQEELIRKKRNKKILEKEEKNIDEILKSKERELYEIRMEFAKYRKEGILDADQKIMSVVFNCEKLGFEYSVVCKNTDLLLYVIENILKKEKDELENYSNYLYITTNDLFLDPKKSMENNNIHDGDVININYEKKNILFK